MATFNATDSNFSKTDNWIVSGTTLKTMRVGSEIVGKFTGSSLTASVNADGARKVVWQVNYGNFQEATLVSGANNLTLATGLGAGTHIFRFYYSHRGASAGNRWDGPDVTINSFTCDALVAVPTSPKKFYLYGDSITAGYQLNNTHVNSLSMMLREAFPEYSVSNFAIGGTGWNNPGGGNIPIFPNHWDLAWGGTPYPFDMSPELVYIAHGQNDQPHTDAVITSAVTNTVNAMVSKWPAAKIFVQTPYLAHKRSAIIAGVNAVSSPNVKLLDLGTEYERNIVSGASTYYTTDQVHPNLNILPAIAARTARDIAFNMSSADFTWSNGTIPLL